MRPATAIGIALAAHAAIACVDYDLDSRGFRCDDDPGICGDGWVCGADDYCTRDPGGDAGGEEVCGNGVDDDGDDEVDCLDSECGVASCEGPCLDNPECLPDGSCDADPMTIGTPCGAGCMCDGSGVAHEVMCTDGSDNDDDGLVDCLDDDCAEICTAGVTCCDDGACRPSC